MNIDNTDWKEWIDAEDVVDMILDDNNFSITMSDYNRLVRKVEDTLDDFENKNELDRFIYNELEKIDEENR